MGTELNNENDAVIAQQIQQQIAAIDAEARRWVLRLQGETPSPQDRAAHKAWVNADPRHQYAYREAQMIWASAAQLRHLCQPGIAGSLRQPATQSRWWFWLYHPGALAASVVLVVAGVLGLLYTFPGATTDTYTTPIAEIRDIGLADGSRVTLGANSAIAVTYSRTERRVVLNQGEAFFQVAAEPQRAFVVLSRQSRIEVLGTQFEVRRGVGRVNIAVAEGRVKVAAKAAGRSEASWEQVPAITLTPGKQVTVTDNGLAGPAQQVDLAMLGAWRQGRLYYKDTPLREVVADANRYYSGHIQLASNTLGDLLITGSFRSDRIDQMLANLEQILPVSIVERGENAVIVPKRH